MRQRTPTSEPMVLSVSVLNEQRWYIVQIGDYFDQVAYNVGGSRGPEPGLFLITGPDYHGMVTAGMKQIKIRTKIAVVANRVFVNGDADLAQRPRRTGRVQLGPAVGVPEGTA